MMSHSSHQNATFMLSKQLGVRQHRVLYAGPEIGIDGDNLRINVEKQGFAYEVLDPFRSDESASKNSCSDPLELHRNYLNSLVDGDLFRHFLTRIKPDLILLDVHHPLLSIIFYGLGLPVVFISTKILLDKDDWVPPLYSSIIPEDTESSKAEITECWKRHFEHHRMDDNWNEFLLQLSNRYNFPYKDLFTNERSIVPFGFKLPQIVLWNAEFDFPRQSQNLIDKYYVGDLIDLSRREQQIEVADDKPIIYCALGTRFKVRNDQKTLFQKKLISVFRSMNQYRFVMAVGDSFEFESTGLSPNIQVIRNAPQISVLKKASLMITHGGGNSIKECIRLGVPMLCYPHDNDQFGNSARVVYHKIGLRGNMHESENAILEKIQMSITSDLFRVNILRFKSISEQAESSQRGVKVIESFLGLT